VAKKQQEPSFYGKCKTNSLWHLQGEDVKLSLREHFNLKGLLSFGDKI
jgi:hypothetical protein